MFNDLRKRLSAFYKRAGLFTGLTFKTYRLEYFLIMEIAKKSYEISYALFRISENLKNKNFGDHLEYQALRLLTSSALSDFQSLGQTLKAIETVLRFGADVNVVAHNNKELILAAIGELNAAITENEKAAKAAQEFNLDDIFAAPVLVADGSNRQDDQESGNLASRYNNEATPVAAYNRQSAILERIRQNNDCRLKDIQEVLPNASERTLRYDLQKLCEQGMVERVGNGGPGSYYKIKPAEIAAEPR